MTMHEWERRLTIALRNGAIDKGSAGLAIVSHDDDCAFLSGGICNCDPDITITTTHGDVHVMADGALLDIHEA
jgi:hypothetical protein